jgi:hypothetical protein
MKAVTVVFTDQGGPIVNTALELRYTHVLITFDGVQYYEATWPKVCISSKYKHTSECRLTFQAPTISVDMMEAYARSQLGRKYSFWGYFFPSIYGRTRGIYCSQYVCDVLRAGEIPIPKGAGWSPDKLLKTLKIYLTDYEVKYVD